MMLLLTFAVLPFLSSANNFHLQTLDISSPNFNLDALKSTIDSTDCLGGLDVYFVCDNSRSVGSGMRTSGVDFLTEVIQAFWVGDNFQTEIIYFSATAETMLPLTGDRTEISRVLNQLRSTSNIAGTRGYTGMELARATMESRRVDGIVPFSLVFFLTDGVDQRFSNLLQEAQQIKDLGYYIFGIGIGGYDAGQIQQVVSDPASEFFAGVENYDLLPTLAAELIEDFCIEVSVVTPASWEVCHEGGRLEIESTVFEASGRGFFPDYLIRPNHKCRFRLESDVVADATVVQAEFINEELLRCPLNVQDFLPSPITEAVYPFVLEVSLDGILFTNSDASANIVVDLCAPSLDSMAARVCHDGFTTDAVAVFLPTGPAIEPLVANSDIPDTSSMSCRFIPMDSDLPQTGFIVPATVTHDENGNEILACVLELSDVFDDSREFVGSYQYDFHFEFSSNNGDTFTASQAVATLYVDNCAIVVPPPSTPVPWDTILLVALPFLLFPIWWFFPLLCYPKEPAVVAPPMSIAAATVVAPETLDEPLLAAPPPPAAAPPKVVKKKWAKVDTSNYIWARSGGGASPLHTNWGNLGAVASAPGVKMTVVEDAEMARIPSMKDIKEEEPQGEPPVQELDSVNGKKSCCGSCLAGTAAFFVVCVCFVPSTLASCYNKCAAMRPRKKSHV